MKKVTLWEQPRKMILEKIPSVKNEPEMTPFESAFLCGLIKQQMPKKIVEVGIAGGGTSAIIMECLSKLSDGCEFHAVDISEKFYRDKKKRSGFLAEEAGKYIKNVKYQVHLGKIAVEYIDVIGENIDLLLLDTTHALPGEVLDFLTLYPYLSKNATVVLHDTAYNHFAKYGGRLWICSKGFI